MRRKGETSSNGENRKEIGDRIASKQRDLEERRNLVLWRQPLLTLYYFGQEFVITSISFAQKTLGYYKSIAVGSLLLAAVIVVTHLCGHLETMYSKIFWCVYWVILGVLSSIGLGTGLHTFVLYLGPHIADVTRAAYACGGLDFPEPPYPSAIRCGGGDHTAPVTTWNILRKVYLEAIMWGAGTALGELPPYFMARAARKSGLDPDDESELAEFEELQKKKAENPDSLSLFDRAKLMIENLVTKVGFLGILVCASIPNPFFDLAGITCGHFLVPFWTFFGATLIGKAIIKMMLQAMFVIIAFSDTQIEKLNIFLETIPVVGLRLQKLLHMALETQKNKLSSSNPESSKNPLATIFESFVFIMVCYFIVSIINSFAQSYHKRLCTDRYNDNPLNIGKRKKSGKKKQLK